MKIIAISDLHGNTQIFPFIVDKLQEADLVLLSGDITHFGKKDQLMLVLDEIYKYNNNVYGIPGNCDYPEVDEQLSKLNINLNKQRVFIDNVCFTGIGGSLPCPTKTPLEYSEEEIKEQFEASMSNNDENTVPFVFLFHQPPYNTKNDCLSTGEHVGSASVRSIIEKYQPLVCFTGHIHEGTGIDEIGNSKIINPGPFNSGKYAFVEIKNGQLIDYQIKYIV